MQYNVREFIDVGFPPDRGKELGELVLELPISLDQLVLDIRTLPAGMIIL